MDKGFRKRALWTVLAGAVGVLVYHQFRTSPEWRQFRWSAVWAATRGASAGFLLGATGLIYLSHILRTWRWQGLMAPSGRFWPVLKGTLIGFTGLALLGRPGDFVRPYYIARKHRSEFSPQLAVLVLERAFDMAAVVLLVGLALGFDPRIHQLTRGGSYDAAFRRAGLLLSGGVVVVLGLLYAFHRHSPRIVAALRRRSGGRPGWRHHVEYFLETLAQGMSGLTRTRTLVMSLVYSLLVWGAITGALWMIIHGYPTLLPGFTFPEALLLMGLTSVGSVLQLPAVGGGFQVITIFGLTQIFGASVAGATSAALLVWIIFFYAIAPFGAALAAREGISWRGMEKSALAAELAAEQGS